MLPQTSQPPFFTQPPATSETSFPSIASVGGAAASGASASGVPLARSSSRKSLFGVAWGAASRHLAHRRYHELTRTVCRDPAPASPPLRARSRELLPTRPTQRVRVPGASVAHR